MSHIESQLVHAPNDTDPRFGDVVCPIHLTSTFEQERFGKPIRYDYSRGGNPSRQVVEDQIALLEGGKTPQDGIARTGTGAQGGGLAFSSGMAAITAVLSLFGPGDVIVTSGNLYGGTFRVLDQYFARYGLRYQLVDCTDPAAVERALTAAKGAGARRPAALLLESPTNPLLEVADIAVLAGIAHKHGAMTIVDNTFMSPYLQRPLLLGADIVIHSATKYLGGHSDVLAGLVAVNDCELYHRLRFIQYSTGATLGAFDSYLLLRGMKTLALRMDRACENALEIAERLQRDSRVAKVTYPGLPTHPGHGVHQKQASAGGAMLAIELAEDLDAHAFVQALGLITLAESLGAVESLISHPATMTHASVPKRMRQEMGITDQLLRVSVGIEHVEDLLDDLDQALDAAL
ncbi:MAG: PLP-dependent aspartate aminotransferase family protein, partial [Coriobacteriales bacterium]|nr:PLP-dependent aspartate aminotransferase family protein [Coriobacteriales bacterium]